MADSYLKPVRGSSYKVRGLSPALWSSCPLGQLSVGMIDEGFGFLDDFLTFNDESPWVVSVENNGGGTATAVLADAKGGVLTLDSDATTQHSGIQIQLGGATGAASFVPNASSKVYFEARVKIADIGSTTLQAFVGLSEVDTTVIDSGANTSANHVGFEMIDSTVIDLKSEKAGDRSASGSVGTLADGTYVKLGFLIDGLTKITPYVNGEAGTAVTTYIPIVAMTPSLVIQSGGTTDPIMSVDWVACYQAEQISN